MMKKLLILLMAAAMLLTNGTMITELFMADPVEASEGLTLEGKPVMTRTQPEIPIETRPVITRTQPEIPIETRPVITRPVTDEARPVMIKPILERQALVRPYERVVAKTGDWQTGQVVSAGQASLAASYTGGLGVGMTEDRMTFNIDETTRLTGIDVAVSGVMTEGVGLALMDTRGNVYQGFSQSVQPIMAQQGGLMANLMDGLVMSDEAAAMQTGTLATIRSSNGMVLSPGDYTLVSDTMMAGASDFIIKGYHEPSYQRFETRQTVEALGSAEAAAAAVQTFGNPSTLEAYETFSNDWDAVYTPETGMTSGGGAAPGFTLDGESKIGQVVLNTYNGGKGAAPGEISLYNSRGEMVSTVAANGASLGATANGMWVADFDQKLPEGDYTIRLSDENVLTHDSQGSPQFHVTAEPAVEQPSDYTGTYYVDITAVKTHNIFGPVNNTSPSFQLYDHQVSLLDRDTYVELISTYRGMPFSQVCSVVARDDISMTIQVSVDLDMSVVPNNGHVTSSTMVTFFKDQADTFINAEGSAHYSRAASETMGADENDYSITAVGWRESQELPAYVVAAIGAASSAGNVPGPGTPAQAAVGVLFPPLIAVLINSILEGMRSGQNVGVPVTGSATGTVDDGAEGETESGGAEGDKKDDGPPGDEAGEGPDESGTEEDADEDEETIDGKINKEAASTELTDEEKEKIQEALEQRKANLRKRQALLEANRKRKEAATGLASVILGAMHEFKGEVDTYLDPVIEMLQGLAKDPSLLVGMLENGMESISAAAGFVKDKLGQAAQKLWDDLAVILRGGKAAVRFAGQTVKNIASGLWGAVKDPSKAWAWLKDNVGVEDFKKSIDGNKKLHERIGHVLLGTLKLGGAISGAQDAKALAQGGYKAISGMLDDLAAALSKKGGKRIGRGLDPKFVTNLGDEFVETTIRTEMPGSTLKARKMMQQVADEHGVIIHVRPTNPASRQWLQSGTAVPKPMKIKSKTLTHWDELLGGPKNSEGLVGYFKPKKPSKAMMKNLDPRSKAEIWRRYNQRMAEFDDLAPAMAKLKREGIEVVNGKVINKSTGKFYTGDNDLFDITSFDGKPLSPQAKDSIVRDMMRREGIGVEHPDLRSWSSGGKGFNGTAKGGMENAARAGGEGLDTVRPLNQPIKSSFAGEAIPRDVLNAAHSGGLTREMVQKNPGILKHLKDSNLPIPDWAKDLGQ